MQRRQEIKNTIARAYAQIKNEASHVLASTQLKYKYHQHWLMLRYICNHHKDHLVPHASWSYIIRKRGTRGCYRCYHSTGREITDAEKFHRWSANHEIVQSKQYLLLAIVNNKVWEQVHKIKED